MRSILTLDTITDDCAVKGSLMSVGRLNTAQRQQEDNEEQITILTSQCPHLVSGIQPPREAVHVVKMAAEVDEAPAQDIPHPWPPGQDSGGGVVAEHDGGVILVLRLITRMSLIT